jgi:hypothetical protein
MTELQSISGMHVYFQCKCGHSSKVSVKSLMERHSKEMTVKEVMKKARCSNCKQKNSFEFRIIYYGNTPAQSLGL